MKLFRTTDTLLVVTMIAAAAFTYNAKHDAEGQMAELRKVQADIRFERETLDILQADLSLLTQPARLQRLVDAYSEELGLAPVDAMQIGTLDDLPPRPLEIEQLISQNPDATAALPPLVDAAATTASVRP
jgi:hypothetical protein